MKVYLVVVVLAALPVCNECTQLFCSLNSLVLASPDCACLSSNSLGLVGTRAGLLLLKRQSTRRRSQPRGPPTPARLVALFWLGLRWVSFDFGVVDNFYLPKSGEGKIDLICVHLLVFSPVAVSQRVNSPDQLSDHVSCLHCPSELQCVNTSRASGPRDAQEDWTAGCHRSRSAEVLSWWQMASCLLTDNKRYASCPLLPLQALQPNSNGLSKQQHSLRLCSC